MWKNVALAAAVGATVAGVGTAALATSGPGAASSATSTAGTQGTAATQDAAASAAGPAARRRVRAALGSALHGSWVTRDPRSSGFVTHEAIRGQVTAVSATSISVRAADGVSQTYTVTRETTVRTRTSGKGSPAAIGDVKVADRVVVAGTGTSALTAKRIVDVRG